LPDQHKARRPPRRSRQYTKDDAIHPVPSLVRRVGWRQSIQMRKAIINDAQGACWYITAGRHGVISSKSRVFQRYAAGAPAGTALAKQGDSKLPGLIIKVDLHEAVEKLGPAPQKQA